MAAAGWTRTYRGGVCGIDSVREHASGGGRTEDGERLDMREEEMRKKSGWMSIS